MNRPLLPSARGHLVLVNPVSAAGREVLRRRQAREAPGIDAVSARSLLRQVRGDVFATSALRAALADLEPAVGRSRESEAALLDRAARLVACGRLRLVELRHERPMLRSTEVPRGEEPRVGPVATPSQELDFGITSLRMPPRLAPGAETVQVEYAVRDPDARVTAVTFELFAAAGTAPVWTKVVRGAAAVDGEHSFAWDGRIVVGPAFPDAYVTLEASPYTLRATVSGRGRAAPARQTATFSVSLAELKVSLGPREALRDPKDLAVFDAMLGAQAGLAQEPVFLDSDLYKATMDEMYTDAAAQSYRFLWGDGPRIPLRAEVWIASAGGEPLLAPMALGNARVLWDYEEPLAALPSDARARRFVTDAKDYLSASAHPRSGVNCHRDHGGKRSAEGWPAVFSTEGLAYASYPTTARRHALYTAVARAGADRGCSGVVFRPSRIAGDAYVVQALLDIERSADAPTPATLPPSPKGGPRSLARATAVTMWREVHFARYLRKKAETTPIRLDVAAKHFAEAQVLVSRRTPAGVKVEPELIPREGYNERILAAANALGRVVSQCALAPVDHHSNGPWFVTFRPYAEFRAAFAAMHPGRSTAQVDAMLRAEGLGDETGYASACEYRWGNRILLALLDQWTVATGISLVHFDRLQPWSHLAMRPVEGGGRVLRPLGGAAPSLARRDATRCLLLVFKTGTEADRTTAHELGHQMFLAHAPSGPVAGADRNAHDAQDPLCLMGYDPKADHFCGLCVLRLQGWSRTRLQPQSERNRKVTP